MLIIKAGFHMKLFRIANREDAVLPRGYKTFSILNSAVHEIYPAHKC